MVIQAPTTSTASRVVINYIHRSPTDDEYNSKQKRERLLHTTSIREWISSIQHNFPDGSILTKYYSHKDALILTLGIRGFDVKRVLIVSGSLTNLLQILVYKKMGLPSFALENPGQLLLGFNGATTTSLGDVVLLV